MDQNLTWLTQMTEEPKSNKGNLTFPSHTVNMIELQSNKKVATLTPISTSTPPPPLSFGLPVSPVCLSVSQTSMDDSGYKGNTGQLLNSRFLGVL